ncbi:MAG: sn-glycerol-3-phosphate ABC transporter ATP-binding protein UgpC [Elusimicrobia bacterium]|nr:sn-glycerol-3-phosphate ABC transporter ATP-binding protein UgpC [Elusimicrobiota bacterium]
MASVTFSNVKKIYGDNEVLHKVNLEIQDKEFLILVGPSGCGKSTLLRMLAGLEEISSGEIAIDGQVVNDLPPRDRQLAMVFQDYALYPHMTVEENMSFGLRIRKLPQEEIDSRVMDAANTLQIQKFLKRKPRQLSGGQRQRVAIGRAIVRKPKVFLFDEPLSNLDAKLREEMRVELAKLHKKLGATMVYVTHDQVEAMTLASRIAVMHAGYIQQIGTPIEVYSRPDNIFVAGFIGSPTMNFMDGSLETEGELLYFKNEAMKLRVPFPLCEGAEFDRNAVVLGVRPEDVYTERKLDKNLGDMVRAKVEVVELLGHRKNVYLECGKSRLLATVPALFKTEEAMFLWFDMDRVHLFDKASGKRIC